MRILLSSVLTVVIAVFFLSESALAGLFGSSWEEDRAVADKCYASANNDPALQLTAGKLVINYPSVAQLSDDTTPSVDEAETIRQGAERVRPCRDLMSRALQKHHPFLVAVFDIRNFQIDLVYVPLIKRQITYGNANRLLHESFLEFQSRWDKYEQARSDEQRRVLAESMRDLSRQAQSSPPPSGTGRMTCRWIGPTLYCDSY
jgi:hypothetical protein